MSVLRKSDERAYSIVPSRSSLSIRDDESFQSERSLIYQELVIDDELFTARVYKRSYRISLIRNRFRKAKLNSAESRERLDDCTVSPAKNAEGRVSEYQASSFDGLVSFPDRDLPQMSASTEDVLQIIAEPIWTRTKWRTWEGKSPFAAFEGPEITGDLRTAFMIWPGCMEVIGCVVMNLAMQELGLFRRLFLEGRDFHVQWLGYCLMTACVLGKSEIIGLVIVYAEGIRWSYIREVLGFHYDWNHLVELALRVSRLDGVELRLSIPHMLECCQYVGPDFIGTAIRKSDVLTLELLTEHDVDVELRE